MTETAQRRRTLIRGFLSLVAAAAFYQAMAMAGVFPRVLLPTIPTVATTLYGMLIDGSMFQHAGATLYRVLLGFGLAIAVGLPLGIMMARFKPVENFFLPLVSALMPIPSFSLVPLFMLWFGIGNLTTVLIVFYAATFPMLFNTWTGVRSVNPLWLRAAGAMGADEKPLSVVIMPSVCWSTAWPMASVVASTRVWTISCCASLLRCSSTAAKAITGTNATRARTTR